MFDVSILQEDLMQALKALDPTVGKNSQNLGDNCLSMVSDLTGQITLSTTNSFEFTKVNIVGNAFTQAAAPLVDFKRFKGIISTIPKNEYISLKQNVNDLLITFSLRRPLKLTGCTTGTIPYPSLNATQTMTIPTDMLIDIMKSASRIIIDSNATPIYNCVKITTDMAKIEVEAIDLGGKRTFYCELTNTINNPSMSVLLEANKLQKSIEIFSSFNYVDINIDPNMNVVELTGNTPIGQGSTLRDVFYSIRTLSGLFPPVKKHFATPPNESIVVSKEEVLNSIARIKAIGDSSSFKTGIEVIADKNNFDVKFNSPYGDLQDPVEVVTPFTSSFKGIFNHKDFEDVISAIDDKEIAIGQFTNSPGSFLVHGVNSPMKYTITGMAQSSTP